MVAQLPQISKNLYDLDYNLWILETAQQLESKNFTSLDLEHLLEEVWDLSQRYKNKLESLLIRLFEHLLKLGYWRSELERNRGHWQGEIINFRLQIKRLLKRSPSLRPFAEQILEDCYVDARKIASRRSQLPMDVFPAQPIATLEQLLDEDWFCND
jgi:hypothetical protein